jgi:hypothetical protein
MNPYDLLDVFFVVFHLAVIVFNLFGWIFRPLRKWNLGLLIATGLSWVVLGFFYGFGYCPLTEWHWDVLAHKGNPPSETSYTQYLINRVFGVSISSLAADRATLIGYLAALALSLWVNIRYQIQKQK